jgi:plasmid stabilization system protein ParE
MKLFYSRTAIADLARHRACMPDGDTSAARRAGSELLERLDALRTFPMTGKPVLTGPSTHPVRELTFRNWTVRHALRDEDIVILRVWRQNGMLEPAHIGDAGQPLNPLPIDAPVRDDPAGWI